MAIEIGQMLGGVSGIASNLLGGQSSGGASGGGPPGGDLRVRIRPVNAVQVFGPSVASAQALINPDLGGEQPGPGAQELLGAAARAGLTGAAGDDNLLSILKDTNGLVFPYTPTINVSQGVDYENVRLVHTNMDVLAYSRTPSVEINITAKFSVQSAWEGRYAIAALHFLRTVSKMDFGEKAGAKAGTPPPMLLLSGYGTYMFNDLRVVLKNHSYTFDENVDGVAFALPGGASVRLPSLFSVQVTLVTQRTPYAMRKEFSLDEFRTGMLLRKGGWF